MPTQDAKPLFWVIVILVFYQAKKNIGTLYLPNLNAIGINILDEYRKDRRTLIKVKTFMLH